MLDIPVEDPLLQAVGNGGSPGLIELLSGAVTGMAILDADFKFRWANGAMCRILGRHLEDIVGMESSEMTHPDDVALSEATKSALSAGTYTSHQARKRYLRPDGTAAPVLRSTSVIRDTTGQLLGWFTQAVDISELVEAQQSLHLSERRFRAMVANSWDIVTLHDAEGRYLYCSPSVTAQLGYHPEEMVGALALDFVHPDDYAAANIFDKVASGETSRLTAQYRLRNSSGVWRWLESTARNQLGDDAVRAIVVTTRDVTEQHRRAGQQDAIAELSSTALRGGPLDSFLDHAVRIVGAALDSDTCSVISEERPGRLRVVVRSGETIVDGPFDACPQAQSLAGEALRSRTTVLWEQEVEFMEPRLQAAGVRSGAAAIIDSSDGPPAALAAYSKTTHAFSRDDVSFLEAAANVLASAANRYGMEQVLRRQALHDDLTGLPNRTLLLDRLGSALARLARRPGNVAALFVDLDNFKLVNDGLGYPTGDRVVSEVAGRLVTALRDSDTVARFGGDEFVVVCEDTDDAEVETLAERIREAVSVPVQLDGRAVTITATIGFAVTSDSASTADDLLARADTAMYAAKRAGKDCFAAFTPAMRAEATEHLEAVSGIRRALRAGEFRLVYQPIVDSRTEADVRCEALLRWDHPTNGQISPGSFIDYAEESGLIIPLGEWVLRTACEQSAAWRASGRLSEVSINISGRQLIESDIVANVRDALDSTGAEPRDILLEITETAFMANVERAVAAVRALRDLGVHVGMDDFGTGHSSLSQLARLPFDFIKIDQSFVQDLGDRHSTDAMLEAILTLCRNLDLPAVAEGVETPAQLARIRGLGVPYIQGYLFGRPMPPAQIEQRGWRRPETP